MSLRMSRLTYKMGTHVYLAIKGHVKEGGLFAEYLGSGNRHQVYDFHAACKALGHLRKSENVGRSRQQESACSAVVINGSLDGSQKFRGSLHFVDGDQIESTDKASGIVASGFKHRVVIRSTYWRSLSANCWTSVVLPHCRGPISMTTGVSVRAVATRRAANLCTNWKLASAISD